MRQKKKEKSSSLTLAVYFVILVVFIILVSVVFKTVEVIKNSKYDDNHRFTVAIFQNNNADIISLSHKENLISKLQVKGVKSVTDLESLGIPTDSYINTNSQNESGIKAGFISALLHKKSVKTDLTVLDLLRLTISASSFDNTKIKSESVSADDDRLNTVLQTFFVDPDIESEKMSIQITNSTSVSGLGNKMAKYVGDMGGSVVLVNSSSSPVDKSKIYYKTDSYTVRKLGKVLKIPLEKKDTASISDISIIIGKDREDF